MKQLQIDSGKGYLSQNDGILFQGHVCLKRYYFRNAYIYGFSDKDGWTIRPPIVTTKGREFAIFMINDIFLDVASRHVSPTYMLQLWAKYCWLLWDLSTNWWWIVKAAPSVVDFQSFWPEKSPCCCKLCFSMYQVFFSCVSAPLLSHVYVKSSKNASLLLCSTHCTKCTHF